MGHKARAYAWWEGKCLKSRWRHRSLHGGLCYDAMQIHVESKPAVMRENHMLQQQLGAMQINRIIEYTSSEYVRTNFFPETTPDDWVQHEAWM